MSTTRRGSASAGIATALLAMVAGALTPMQTLRSMFTSRHEALAEEQPEYDFGNIVAGALARNADSEFFGMPYEKAIEGLLIASAINAGSSRYDDGRSEYRMDVALTRQCQYIDAAIVALAADPSEEGKAKFANILIVYEACSGALESSYERCLRNQAAQTAENTKNENTASAASSSVSTPVEFPDCPRVPTQRLPQWGVLEAPPHVNIVASGFDDAWLRSTFGGYPG